MAGKHKFRREGGFDYDPLFKRIEEAFSPEEMDADTIKDYINAKTFGMEGLAEQISQASIIKETIEKSTNINELKELLDDASKIPVHSQTLVRDINEKVIALSIQIAEDFAKEKRVKLDEKRIARVEKWKTKDVLVIREKGRFKAWKKL
jgi:hypothetical protein